MLDGALHGNDSNGGSGGRSGTYRRVSGLAVTRRRRASHGRRWTVRVPALDAADGICVLGSGRNAAGLGFQPSTAQPLDGRFGAQLIAGIGGHLNGRNSAQSTPLQHWTGRGQ